MVISVFESHYNNNILVIYIVFELKLFYLCNETILFTSLINKLQFIGRCMGRERNKKPKKNICSRSQRSLLIFARRTKHSARAIVTANRNNHFRYLDQITVVYPATNNQSINAHRRYKTYASSVFGLCERNYETTTAAAAAKSALKSKYLRQKSTLT